MIRKKVIKLRLSLNLTNFQRSQNNILILHVVCKMSADPDSYGSGTLSITKLDTGTGAVCFHFMILIGGHTSKVESRPSLRPTMPRADVIKGGAVVFGNEKP